MNKEVPITEDISSQSLTGEVATQDAEVKVGVLGFLKKIGQTAIGLPERLNDKLMYASIAVANDPINSIKRTAEAGIVAAGMTPIDESIRYGVFGVTHVATNGNPIISGAAFGLTTFATQGITALATADLLETNVSKRLINRLNNRINSGKKGNQSSQNQDMAPITQGAIAMVGGTAPLLALKQRKNPERSKRENQKFGLKVAGAMGTYFALEEAGVSKLADMYGWPKTIAGMAVALTASQKVYSKVMENKSSSAELDSSTKSQYEIFHDSYDQALRVGIFGEDIERALADPRTIRMSGAGERADEGDIPVLVPVDTLEWFNTDLMKRTYGDSREVMVYVHPPFTDAESTNSIKELIMEQINAGKVVLTEMYGDDEVSPVAQILAEGSSDLDINPFGGEIDSRVDFFVGKVNFNGAEAVKETPSLYEVYKDGIESKMFTDGANDGSSLAAVIEGEEAEKIWDIYDKPFEGLGKDDPTLAGFDKESLMDILKDPEIPKIVHRVDGEITTMMLFLQDFSKAPWFNPEVYKQKYPEYFKTNNILIFPGIVTDEKKRGNSYASDMIDFAAQLFAHRGSSLLITFECTEVSTTYIPEIVTAAIENSGLAKVSELDQPIGQIKYFGLSQKTNS